jgi:hypothetical protein
MVVQEDASRYAVQVSIVSSDQNTKCARVALLGQSKKFSITGHYHVRMALSLPPTKMNSMPACSNLPNFGGLLLSNSDARRVYVFASSRNVCRSCHVCVPAVGQHPRLLSQSFRSSPGCRRRDCHQDRASSTELDPFLDEAPSMPIIRPLPPEARTICWPLRTRYRA